MKLLDRLFGRKAADPLAVWAELLRKGVTSKSGQTVNLDNAFKTSVFFACLRVLADGVAQVPFKLHQTQESGGLTTIRAAREHRLYDLVTVSPNEWSTSFEFRETMVMHAALGNAYAYKNMVSGETRELILLNPGQVVCEQAADWTVTYKVTGRDGRVQILPASTIWHVRGPSWDGFRGMDTLHLAREALGLTMALDESVSSLHKDGVRPSGMYSVDGALSKDQHMQITN